MTSPVPSPDPQRLMVDRIDRKDAADLRFGVPHYIQRWHVKSRKPQVSTNRQVAPRQSPVTPPILRR